MNVTVVIATFGDQRWRRLAEGRALPSVVAQALPPAAVVLEHGATLAGARNAGAAQATTEWLCFLDADDELHPDYLEAMDWATGDLRAPAVQYVHPDRDDPPLVLDDRDIRRVNPCVIGTLIRRDLFHVLGGFADWPIYEDWALFLAAHLAGAELVHVPDAIYRAHVSPGSRNSQPRALAERTYHAIRRRHLKRAS